jgi:hypothetical protein
MPLDLSLASTSALRSPDEVTSGVAVDEKLLAELPDKLGLQAPIWRQLAQSAFDDPELLESEVAGFAADVRALRDALPPGDDDATRDVLDQLIALCEEALAEGVGLVGLSD